MKRALVALALLLTACKATPSSAPAPTSTSTTAPSRPVRIGVWTPPDPSANTYGGAAIRELIYPQLFRATPGGKWEPNLVEPTSVATLIDNTEANFRIRSGAKWSDGTPITIEDLRRTMDPRFVQSIDEAPSGMIIVHFTQPLPGWRRLWSGLDAIRPPRDGLFGGPYKVGSITNGLETILVTNDAYWGPKPSIAEVHLVLVPDAEIAARLMTKGELDVVAPLAFTGRIARLQRIKGAHVLTGERTKGGWTAALVANPSRLNLDQRVYLFDFAPARFADVLLHDEATPANAGAPPPQVKPAFPGTPAFTIPQESGPGGVLLHAIQRTAHRAGFDFDLRAAEFDKVLGTYAVSDFDVLLRLEPTFPTECWTCRDANVDAALAKQADAGDASARAALRRKLVVENYELPLWRERPVAAVRDGLDGVSLNGFDAAGPVWDLQHWSWH